MPIYPFDHDSPIYLIYDDNFETAYYVRDRKKYRRLREVEKEEWSLTTEEEVNDDTFWIVVTLIEMRTRNA